MCRADAAADDDEDAAVVAVAVAVCVALKILEEGAHCLEEAPNMYQIDVLSMGDMDRLLITDLPARTDRWRGRTSRHALRGQKNW